MLCEVHITNLALIEKLSLSFAGGLSVLTGETGAGKSIILQAIHLLSGGKASVSWIRSGAESATVEALFEVDGEHSLVVEKLQEKGFDTDGTIILKRVLSGKGRSRFYINGSLATAKFTGELAENLLSVASQHDHQQLLAPRYHLDFIDAVGGLSGLRNAFSTLYDTWFQKKSRYQTMQKKEMEKEQRKDFLLFQVQEISDAQIVAGEDEKLTIEKDRLKGSEQLISLGQKSYALLNQATSSLPQIRKNLEHMAEVDSTLSSLADEVADHSFQLEEKLFDLRSYIEAIPSDPHELDEITARLDTLQQLKRKYGPHLDDVIVYGEKAAKDLAELEALDEQLATLAAELSILEKELLTAAEKLSFSRQKIAADLAKTITGELHALCLDQAIFDIQFTDTASDISAVCRTGKDKPAFFFSANPGEPVKPIAQIASGGELSRLLLALKCLLARQDQVETVIFDEVDSGISGKAAESVAQAIRKLAEHHQVLCITHLPQIASCADDHYRVSKAVSDDRTQTSIIKLNHEKKVEELAGMLDGNSVTPQTLAYVKELISRNQT